MVNVINISKPSQRGEGGEREGYTTRGRTDMLWYGINYTPDCAKRCIAPNTCEKIALKAFSALKLYTHSFNYKHESAILTISLLLKLVTNQN